MTTFRRFHCELRKLAADISQGMWWLRCMGTFSGSGAATTSGADRGIDEARSCIGNTTFRSTCIATGIYASTSFDRSFVEFTIT